MKKSLLIVAIFLLGVINSYPQYTNITVSTTNSPSEPSICINPKNLNQVVGGANINSYYYSTNSGYNWTRGTLTSSAYGVWGDPCIIVDTNGIFYYFHLSNTPSPGYWIDRIVCQKSTNGGMTWNNPGSYTYFLSPKEQDKEWAIVDPATNYIYCTWTQFDNYGTSTPTDSSNILFAKSTDSGESWILQKRINKLGGDCVDEDNTVEGAVPAVGPNGEIYVAWAGPKIRNQQFGIFFDKSTDGGVTWLDNDIYVCDQPGGWDYGISGIYRANGLPVTCCDLSNGPYRGTIYINWTDSAGPNNHDVKIVKSTNGGLNWSTPLRVNDDATTKEQFFTWMTVDQKTGYVYVLFYDRRNDVSNAGATEVFLAKSTNGGTSFTNILISSSAFVPTSSVFFGDYTNITAYDNKVRPIWIRLQGTSLSVMTAIIDFTTEIEPLTLNLPASYELSQNYPNPFNPMTNIRYSLPHPGFVKLSVFNSLGKEVAELVNEYTSAGEHNFDFDASKLSSGVYFYKISVNGFTDTKKMMVIK